MKKLAVIYTVKSVYDTFPLLLQKELGPVQLYNTVDEFLAIEPNEMGEFTVNNLNRLHNILKVAEATHAAAILVTCSTLTPWVKKLQPLIAVPVVAIDDAMVEKAVTLGTRITLLCSAESAVAPIMQNTLQTAQNAGRQIEITSKVCTAAFDAIRAGNKPDHDRLLLEAARGLKGSQDVVMLGQASMAHLERDIEQAIGCPTLSSPGLCIEYLKNII